MRKTTFWNAKGGLLDVRRQLLEYKAVTTQATAGANIRLKQRTQTPAVNRFRNITVADESEDTRTHKIFRALEQACYEFDLGKPIWLDANVEEFKRHAKTRFTQDCFIEAVDFDFLELQVLEED